jgi:hypothetical protein
MAIFLPHFPITRVDFLNETIFGAANPTLPDPRNEYPYYFIQRKEICSLG